jgi:hypothetical protein
LTQDYKLHLTQEILVTLQPQMTKVEVHEKVLSSCVKTFLMVNEATTKENEKFQVEGYELRVNVQILELEFMWLGLMNVEQLTTLGSKL